MICEEENLLSIFFNTSIRTCTFSLMVLLSNAYCGEEWGWGTLKLIFSYMISWWQLLQKDFSVPQSTIMLGLDVKIRSMQKDEWFVKWVGLLIIWV